MKELQHARVSREQSQPDWAQACAEGWNDFDDKQWFVRRRTLDSVKTAQFDVHRNKGNQKDTNPFVVIIQSARFDAYRRRVVVPLVRRSSVPSAASISKMNHAFNVDGADVVLSPLQMVSVALEHLGPVIASLADVGQSITDAMDELMTRLWG
ncbi:CcdB family protein [Variovorax paradoxus]|nr:CcdB family protein [Variovorax paradoxus]